MMSAPAATARASTSALRVSIRDPRVGARAQALDHRQHAGEFLGERHRAGAGPRQLAADVEDVGALVRQLQAVRDRRLGVERAGRRRKSCRA